MTVSHNAWDHVLNMTLMMKYVFRMELYFKAYSISECMGSISVSLKNRPSLVEYLAVAAASAFHKKLTASHECGGMLDSEGLDSVF